MAGSINAETHFRTLFVSGEEMKSLREAFNAPQRGRFTFKCHCGQQGHSNLDVFGENFVQFFLLGLLFVDRGNSGLMLRARVENRFVNCDF